MKNLFRALSALVLATFVFATAAVAVEMPKSVIHVINVRFKADAAKADVDAAIAAIGEMAKKFPEVGIDRVWVKTIKIQTQGGGKPFTHCLIMEFKSEAHLTKYAGSAAQKFFYDKYMKVYETSNTNDVTN